MNKSFVWAFFIAIISISIAGIFTQKNKAQPYLSPKGSNKSIFGELLMVSPTNKPNLPGLTLTPTIIYETKPTIPPGFCEYIPVIFYHHIAPADIAIQRNFSGLNVNLNIFQEHLNYLSSEGYQTINAEILINSLNNETRLSKSIMITFDDGYSDIYEFVYPLIREKNQIINLFISTGLINNPGYLTWGELKEMSSSGLVYVYNHTWSHYPPRGDLEKLKWEIATAQTQIKENLGKESIAFAYPYGTFTQLEIAVLLENNISGAFTTIANPWQCKNKIFSLGRIRIGNAPLSAYGL